MKSLTVFFLLLFAGCGAKDTLVGVIPASNSNPTAGSVRFPLAPYEESLDTLYYKLWSDSSWTAYGGTKVIGTATYTVVKDNAGDEYYYSPQGYAGFYTPGSSVILFDTPLGAWPDSLPINGQINEATTFTYQGSSWTMYNTYTLADTTSAGTSFGTFDPCLHLQFVSILVLAGTGSSASEDMWLANGPGQIAQEDQLGNITVMVSGHVNGKSWGVVAAKAAPAGTLSKSGPKDLLRVVSAGLGAKIHFRRSG